MTTIETENRDPIGAVFTPLIQAQKTIIEWGIYDRWRRGEVILDPTAGSGHFIEAFIKTAGERGDRISRKMLCNLYAVEMQHSFVQSFRKTVLREYKVDFPEENFVQGDYLFTDLNIKADCLVGNPPWLNFCDLEEDYKEKIKHLFLASGLGGNKKDLLLGNSRIDLAALIVTESIRKNLKEGGGAFFYLPLSLFLGDGAHKGFRTHLDSGFFSVDKICDYRDYSIFPGVSTRYGFVSFTKGKKTTFPVPYDLIDKKGRAFSKKASPLGSPDSPFVIHRENERWQIPSITISRKSKPRQGLNTCGANRLFLFDKAIKKSDDLLLLGNRDKEALLPADLIYPLIGAGQFKGKEQHRYVFLPYGKDGRAMTEETLSAYPEAMNYLNEHRALLVNRKGVLIGSSIDKGLWWSLLGIGPYSFAPWKVVWEAYGKKDFRPRIFSSTEGSPWQPNQALQAYLPFWSKEEACEALSRLQNPKIEEILRSQGMEGTCNWAQPGKMMKFFRFRNED